MAKAPKIRPTRRAGAKKAKKQADPHGQKMTNALAMKQMCQMESLIPKSGVTRTPLRKKRTRGARRSQVFLHGKKRANLLMEVWSGKHG